MKAAQLSRVICNLCSPLGIAEIRRQIPIISGRSHKISPMASGEHDNTKIHTFYTKRLSGSSSRTDDSQTRQDASDHDYYISSNENQCRRPSTAEDEQRVKNLLKEIIAYRENNLSSWIVEVCLTCVIKINIKVPLSACYSCISKMYRLNGWLCSFNRVKSLYGSPSLMFSEHL